jgi:hypothetical protein
MKITNVNFDVMYNPKKWVINSMLSSLFLPFLSPSFYVTSLCVPWFRTYNKLCKIEGCIRKIAIHVYKIALRAYNACLFTNLTL